MAGVVSAAIGPPTTASAKKNPPSVSGSPGSDQVGSASAGSPALSGLLHATPDQVRNRLGEPSIARTEGRGALWTYEGPHCALFVFFKDDGGLHVSGAAAGPRHRGVAAPELDVCLGEMGRSDVAGRSP